MNKKILIISHLSINNTNNVGKTLLQLFDGFDSETLFQLYFNPIPPNVNKCKSWYRITDDEIIRSYWGHKAGGEYQYVDSAVNEASNLYKKSIGKSTAKLLVRDIVWRFGRINWKSLIAWLDRINPDIIFLAPGYSNFVYRIARKIAALRKIPIVFFAMDDFYNEIKENNNFAEYLRRQWLKYNIKKTIKLSKILLTVSEEMAIDYQNFFKVKTAVLYTPYERKNILDNNYETKNKEGFQFIYAGSLGLNRWKTLLELGKIINDNHLNAFIDIYANPAYEKEINKLNSCECIRYKGFVGAEELSCIIKKTDAILHVESFEKEELLRIRYSISTKIPECMASGKVFFVIGPKNQASIGYLLRNQAALVCTNYKEIEITMKSLLAGEINYSEYRENAYRLLKKNHSPEATFSFLKNVFNDMEN